MGRVEKQIIAGALALVAIFLSVVVYKGIQEPVDATAAAAHPATTDYPDPGAPPLLLPSTGSAPGAPASAEGSSAVELGAPPPAAFEAAGSGAALRAAESRQAAELPAGLPDLSGLGYAVYEVRAGDTLGEIAQRELGSVRYLEDIRMVNEGLDPHSLVPGQKIWLPAGADPAPSAAPAALEAPNGRTHTVAAGDNLWRISTRYYGDGSGVEAILRANPEALPSKDAVLRIGTVLRIPGPR